MTTRSGFTDPDDPGTSLTIEHGATDDCSGVLLCEGQVYTLEGTSGEVYGAAVERARKATGRKVRLTR